MKKYIFKKILTLLLVASSSTIYAQDVVKFYTEEWPPVTFMGANGKPEGFAVELISEMQKMANRQDSISLVPWARGYNEIKTTKNSALFTVSYDEGRAKLFKFVGPLLFSKTNCYQLANNSKKYQLNNIISSKAIVTVYRETIEHQLLEQMKVKKMHITTTPDLGAIGLLNNRADLWCVGVMAKEKILEKLNVPQNKFKYSFTLLKNDLYLAFSQSTDNSTVQIYLNSLKKIHQNGTYQKVYSKWFKDKSNYANQVFRKGVQ